MPTPRTHLGDSHNFGRRVTRRDDRILKPRALFWEWLFLSAESPLRRFLTEAASLDGLGPSFFSFLPDLAFSTPRSPLGGEVDAVALAPLPFPLSAEQKRDLALVVGRSLALFSWFGVADLHWENLVLGLALDGRIVFAPLDIEMILADLSLPTETKLLPDADPEVAEVCRHAAGVRRVLPYLGKPLDPTTLLQIVASYRTTLVFLDKHARAIADLFVALPELHEMPIRVCLRGTDEYVFANRRSLWPPLLDAETEQLKRGDIPYFFRFYDRPGIHYFSDPELRSYNTLPLEGDVPQLDPMLQVSRGFRSASRKKLREDGLFTLIGAFDHPSIRGEFAWEGLVIKFTKRSLVVTPKGGEELESRRDLRAFVGNVYLPCRCGEVLSVFVPNVTVCEALS